MAKVNLLPRKEFEIILDNGEIIKGQFGTWALKRFCDKRKYSLKEAGEKLGDPSIDDISEYLLCAVEYSARKEKRDFDFTDLDVCGWIDELGGMNSADFISIFNHSAAEETEKKTEVTAEV